jgi:hypothetical protein
MQKKKNISLSARFPFTKTQGFLGAFYLALAVRALHPFFYNPTQFIFSDSMRHWINGEVVFHPTFLSSSDPKLYQLWVWLIRQFADKNDPIIIACFTAILSVATAWVWYKCCRELFPKSPNLGRFAAIIIAIHPATIAIFSFFMTESLLLTMTGLSLWMSFRARRKQTLASFNITCVCWLLTCHTKLIAAPLAIGMLWYLFPLLKEKKKALLHGVGFFFLFAIPAAIHTYAYLNVINPFQFTMRESIYRLSGTQAYSVIHERKDGTLKERPFAAPPFFSQSLSPFGEYYSYRQEWREHPDQLKKIFTYEIDVTKGNRDWDRVYKKLKKHYTADMFLYDLRDNVVYTLFGPSWPDATIESGWLFELNYHLRWMWAPLILILFIYGGYIRVSEQKSLFVGSTIVMVLVFFFQQFGVMDPRYRKVIEPMLIICFFIFIEQLFFAPRKETQRFNIWDSLLVFFIRPLYQQIKTQLK